MIRYLILIILGVIFIAFFATDCGPKKQEAQLRGDYMGQAPPNNIPELFAPGIVSDGYNNRDMAISPDGNRILYSIWLPRRSGVIMEAVRHGDIWGRPEVASFSGSYSDLEPAFSHDGRRLYFSSNRPREEHAPVKDYDIWYVELNDSGWGGPVNVGNNVNSDGNEFYPSLTAKDVLYFTAPFEGSEDIFKSEMINGQFTKPARLGEAINSGRGEFNALIAPDESFLVFSSYGREDDLGGSDMYISFRSDNGSWAEAQNLGAPLNSNRIDYCPALSPDGKYFFFTSGRISQDMADKMLSTYDDIVNMESSPANGNDDIYWVNSRVLDQFRGEQ